MKAKVHWYAFLVKECHLDTFGHVNHAVYLTLYEEARWDLITANGYGLKEIIEEHLGPVILEARVKYRKELRLREKVTVRTELLSYRKLLATVRQEMRNAGGELCSEAEFVFALFDTVQRKLVAPTERWLKALGVEEE